MTRRMTGRTASAAALFAVAAVAILAIGTGMAQPGGKDKPAQGKADPVPSLEPNPVADALRDEFDLLQAQSKLKQLGVTNATARLKSEEDTLKRLEAVSDSVAQSELARQRMAVAAAKADAETKAAELAAHELLVKAAKRKLDYAVAHPPKPTGPSAADAALAKLVQLAAERNAAEKEWMAKEAARLADEAKRQKAWADEERTRREREWKLREDEVKDAKAQAQAERDRATAAEERLKEEMKKRLDAEAERQRAEKAAVLKRLPGEIADVDLRLRAAELKREQLKLELDATAREVERQKAARAQLEELRAMLEKELKAKVDR